MRVVITALCVLLFPVFSVSACTENELASFLDGDTDIVASGEDELVILVDDVLTRPVEKLGMALKRHLPPGFAVKQERSASDAVIDKICRLGRKADIVFLSDRRLIHEYLSDRVLPAVNVAHDEMVFAYSLYGAGCTRVSTSTWWNLLCSPSSRPAFVDPAEDAAGYRALMTLKLAAGKYLKAGNVSETPLRLIHRAAVRGCLCSSARRLLKLLRAGVCDYTIIYRSIAVQNKIPFLRLPSDLNLGCSRFPDHAQRLPVWASDMSAKKSAGPGYFRVNVLVPGRFPGVMTRLVGSRITYVAAVLRNTRHPVAARLFLRFMIEERGRDILIRNGLAPVIFPARIYKLLARHGNVPPLEEEGR